MMHADEFVSRLRSAATEYKTMYISGCFGAPMTTPNKERYSQRDTKRAQAIQNATVDTFGFDCVCLIKGILWGWNGNVARTYGGATYASYGVPDINESAMIERCVNVSTDFSGIVPGAAVWMPGHIGVYVGDGLCVECTPIWKNGVQLTALGNLAPQEGYNKRTWTKWGLLPYVDYAAPVKEGWSDAAKQWAVSTGLIKGGDNLPDGTPDYMWDKFLTREQLATVLHRYAQLTGQA